ncbi:hypothetical protein Tco_1158605, partial [Tanacetum coccineum]
DDDSDPGSDDDSDPGSDDDSDPGSDDDSVPGSDDDSDEIREIAGLFGWTDTEFEPFEDPIETKTPESPHTVAPSTSLPEGTLPTLVPILRRTARMAVRVPPAMLSGLSSSMPKVGTSKLVEDDEEIEESFGSDSSLGMGVESRGSDDESHRLDDEGHSVESDRLGLGEEEEVVPEGQQRAVSVMGAAMSTPLGLGYEALRRRELALEEDRVYNTFEVGKVSGSAPEFKRPERVSASRLRDLLTELGAQVEMQGGLIHDHMVQLAKLSHALFK